MSLFACVVLTVSTLATCVLAYQRYQLSRLVDELWEDNAILAARVLDLLAHRE